MPFCICVDKTEVVGIFCKSCGYEKRPSSQPYVTPSKTTRMTVRITTTSKEQIMINAEKNNTKVSKIVGYCVNSWFGTKEDKVKYSKLLNELTTEDGRY